MQNIKNTYCADTYNQMMACSCPNNRDTLSDEATNEKPVQTSHPIVKVKL